MIISHNISGQNARQKLKESRVQPENGEEEKNGHDDTEYMAQRRLRGWYSDKEKSKRVRNK